MRITKNRTKILEKLKNSSKSYTAADLHKLLPEMDLATIYRNLNLFVENSVVRELRISKGESTYEINNDGHEHAVCNNCGEVKHIHIDKSKLKKALNLDDFEIEDIEINIKGYCK